MTALPQARPAPAAVQLRLVDAMLPPVPPTTFAAADLARLQRAIARLHAGDLLSATPYKLERVSADLTKRGTWRHGFYILTVSGWPVWKVEIPCALDDSVGGFMVDRPPCRQFPAMARDMLRRGIEDWWFVAGGGAYAGTAKVARLG